MECSDCKLGEDHKDLKMRHHGMQTTIDMILIEQQKVSARLDEGADKMRDTKNLIYLSMLLGVVVEFIFMGVK